MILGFIGDRFHQRLILILTKETSGRNPRISKVYSNGEQVGTRNKGRETDVWKGIFANLV